MSCTSLSAFTLFTTEVCALNTNNIQIIPSAAKLLKEFTKEPEKSQTYNDPSIKFTIYCSSLLYYATSSRIGTDLTQFEYQMLDVESSLQYGCREQNQV